MARTTKTVLSQSSRTRTTAVGANGSKWSQKTVFNEFLRAFGGCFAPRLVHKCSGRWSGASGQWSGVSDQWSGTRKVPVSFRLDPRVLVWLRAKGEGHLTRINDILANLMEAERRAGSGR